MTTIEAKPIAIYARTPAGDELSMNAQIEKGREYAEEKGRTVAREYCDAQGSREQFAQMMADADQETPPFEEIVVWSFSRFSRSAQEFRDCTAKLEARSIKVVSIDESPTQ